ncbi:alpha/beta hydrolase [Chitinimonas sp.]|uniref:alpha/beta hydrolase n=1 Tax=Chitinimonas sp. TaxID=1934313 RepID=UPI0035B49B60
MRTIIQGRFSHRLRSMWISCKVASDVLLRRALGKPLVAEWPWLVEYATLYIRAQFNHAFAREDFAEGRAYFDSVYGVVRDYPDVAIRATGAGEPPGHWFIPTRVRSDATMLHFHGGGYAFYAGVSHHFAACMAHTLGIRIFAPDYRLTPEHPHPAQRDDALAAYAYLLQQGVNPAKLILCGDSAGGHLALMTRVNLQQAGLPAPALTIGLSPWTDTGLRGASQFGNDRYDLVQGHMTVQFSRWLKGGQPLSDAELSPIYQDFSDLGPVYLQAGGLEILVDMIRAFASTVKAQGGQVRLDVWPQMMHEFQSYGDYLPESREALQRLAEAIDWATGKVADFAGASWTECDHWRTSQKAPKASAAGIIAGMPAP